MCTSVLAASLNQLNQNCADQIQLVNKECNERIQTLDSSLVTGEGCCRNVESLSQEIEMLKTKIEAESDSLRGKIIIFFYVSKSTIQHQILIFRILSKTFFPKID